MMSRLEVQMKSLWRSISGENISQSGAVANPSILKGHTVSLPNRINLHVIFEEMINSNNNESETAADIAIWHASESITYASLNQRANIMARILGKTLKDHGVKNSMKQSDALVGIMMSQGISRISMQLACWKLGLPFTFIVAELSDTQIKAILTNSQPICFVINEIYYDERRELFENLSFQNNLIFFENLLESGMKRKTKAFNLEPDECFFVGNNPLSSVFYTESNFEENNCLSPVRLYHKQIWNQIKWCWNEVAFEDCDILCHYTLPFCIDTMLELFTALLRGNAIVVVDPGDVHDINQFSTLVSQRYISTISLSTAQLKNWLDQIKGGQSADVVQKLLTLRIVNVRGQIMVPPLAKSFFDVFPCGKRLVSRYFATEACGEISLHIFRSKHDIISSMSQQYYIPVGLPVYNTEIYIVNDNFQSVENGCQGRICVSGMNVSDDRAGLISQAHRHVHKSDNIFCQSNAFFTENKINPRRGFSTMLCTGETGFIHNNRLYLQGDLRNNVLELRNNSESKSFYALEIDSIIYRHPSIAFSSTLVTEVDRRVACFYQTKNFEDIHPSELQNMCLQSIPACARPEFHQISAMPVNNINYTIDQNALRKFYFNYHQERIFNKKDKSSTSYKIKKELSTYLGKSAESLKPEANLHDCIVNPLYLAEGVERLRSLGYPAKIRTFAWSNQLELIVPQIQNGLAIIKSNCLVQPSLDDVVITPLLKEDDEMAYFLAEAMPKTEDLYRALKISYEEVANFVEDHRELAISTNLSLVMRSQTDNDIFGATMAFKSSEEPLFSHTDQLEMLAEFLYICDPHNPPRATKYARIPQRLSAECDCTGAHKSDSTLRVVMFGVQMRNNGSSRTYLEVTERLLAELLAQSKTLGYSTIECITSNLWLKMFMEEFGFKTMKVTSLNEFLEDNSFDSYINDEDVSAYFMSRDLHSQSNGFQNL